LPDFTLLYLHGFLSSPQSSKAQQAIAHATQLGIDDKLLVPFLDGGPAATLDALEALLAKRKGRPLGLIGSSLGGFYAMVLAERYSAPAVLINPAIDPWLYWADHLGEHHNYHTGQLHVVSEDHVAELEAMAPEGIQDTSNYRVFLQRHDEVLDANVALNRFGAERCKVREDGNHSYAEFAEELPAAFDFLLSRITNNVR